MAAPATSARRGWLAATLAVIVLVAVGVTVWQLRDINSSTARETQQQAGGPASASDCPHQITAVTASSFVTPLKQVAATLARGSDCIGVTVHAADGRTAGDQVAALGADVWIPDDTAWAQLPSKARLASGSGTVVATSPLLFVTRAGDSALPSTAQSWLGLAKLLATRGTWKLITTDPAQSGAGLNAVGGLADAILDADGPVASALDILQTWKSATTATTAALPTRANQVGIVPESTLLASGHADDFSAVAPSDGAQLMRYALFPTARAAADTGRQAAVQRLRAAFSSATARTALATVGLRGPSWPASPPSASTEADLPSGSTKALPPVPEHFVYHVLATWHPSLRRSNMLVIVDVSGSMAGRTPGGTQSRIAAVQSGLTQVASLLPDNARLGVWEFGSQLDPPNDWRALVEPEALTSAQRGRLANVTDKLYAMPTGTGLYDTVAAGYAYQQQHFSTDMPNEVVIFTDGVNEDDPMSIGLARLRARLAATDPHKRVQLSIFGIGKQVPAGPLQSAVQPVGGQVDILTTPQEVLGGFVHAVSGALSGVPG